MACILIVIVLAGNFTYAPSMVDNLNWPAEVTRSADLQNIWQQTDSNICLDFHGDPVAARLVIFSDGNHHMALLETAQAFLKLHPETVDIFYATTPPSVLIKSIEHNGVSIGNLKISRNPDVFIAPDSVIGSLLEKKLISTHQAFAISQGNVLLIKKGNPKNIAQITDLLRETVTLFISNPQTEQASYRVYRDTLIGLCEESGIDINLPESKLDAERKDMLFGEKIHHREAPQAIYSNAADVAILYYHLALRYCRIFPNEFDFIPLGGTRESPQPSAGNVCSNYHAGVVNSSENKSMANAFIQFLLSDEGKAIYESHGLRAAI
jgi:ABC-type molybdate transport system substrate-binding protein